MLCMVEVFSGVCMKYISSVVKDQQVSVSKYMSCQLVLFRRYSVGKYVMQSGVLERSVDVRYWCGLQVSHVNGACF